MSSSVRTFFLLDIDKYNGETPRISLSLYVCVFHVHAYVCMCAHVTVFVNDVDVLHVYHYCSWPPAIQDLRYIEELRKLREAEAAIMSKAKRGRGAEYESVTSAGGRSGLWRPPTKPLAAAAP